MGKKIKGEALIKDLAITPRTKKMLQQIGVFTIADLHTMYETDTFPKIRTRVNFYPYSKFTMLYTKQINEEVKQMLGKHCGIKKLDHVGVS